ncbi:MAG: hypothetical protein M3256_27190, partial [Actinomycetota bacterium]|nr:hypothetical protein [Actinomycetota bacterium]
HATIELDGIPRGSGWWSRARVKEGNPVGMIRSIEHLSEDLATHAAAAAQTAQDEAAEATRAASRLGLPFEHTGRLASLRQRLAEINETLNPVEDEAGAVALEGADAPVSTSTTAPAGPAAPDRVNGPMSAADLAANASTVAYPNGVSTTPSNGQQEPQTDGARPEAESDLEPGG